jgi:hypothetical protein
MPHDSFPFENAGLHNLRIWITVISTDGSDLLNDPGCQSKMMKRWRPVLRNLIAGEASSHPLQNAQKVVSFSNLA